MNPARLTDALVAEARRLGFVLAGVCPAVAPPGLDRLRAWVEAGHAGSMKFFVSRAEAYSHPRHVLPGVRGILMLGLPYRTVQPRPTVPGQGRIARYAWGSDYHDPARARLGELVRLHRRLVPDERARGVVDTAPFCERTFGQLAGLGWIGRNTSLIHPELGSWFFLAALLSTAELAGDPERALSEAGDRSNRKNACGACRACVESCPTGALSEEGRLDARRCVSYLTIEHDGPIPHELRPKLGDRLLGCDACQEVCPWNQRDPTAPSMADRLFFPGEAANPVDLAGLLTLDASAYRARWGHTPLGHAGRARVLRNAAILLGNRPDPAALAVLIRCLNDAESLVRGASAWALGHYAGETVREALAARLVEETEPEVRREMELLTLQPGFSSREESA